MGDATSSPRRGRVRQLAALAGFVTLFALSNALGYVYTLLMARWLDIGAFGVLTAILGIVNLAGIVSNAVQNRATAQAVHDSSRRRLLASSWSVARVAAPVVVVATLAGMLGARWIGATPAEAAVGGATALAMLLGSAPLGHLMALGRQNLQAAIVLVGTVARVAGGAALVALGAGVTGGLGGFFLNYAVIALAGLAAARRLSPPARSARSDGGGNGDADGHVAGTAVVPYVAQFGVYCTDVALVQAIAPALGGSYAALSTVAKLVFIGAYPVVLSAFSSLARGADRRRQVQVAAAAGSGVLLVAGVPALVLTGFAEPIVRLFFGARFASIAPDLPWAALAMLLFTLSVMATQLLLLWRQRGLLIVASMSLATMVVLTASRHGTLGALVQNLAVACALQLVLCLLLVAVGARERPGSAPTVEAKAASGSA